MRRCERCDSRLPGRLGHGFVYGHRVLCSHCTFPKFTFLLEQPKFTDGFVRFSTEKQEGRRG